MKPLKHQNSENEDFLNRIHSLEEEDSLFKHLLEVYPHAVLINNFDGKAMFCNEVFLNRNGFKSIHDVVGKTHEQLGYSYDINRESVVKELIERGSVSNLEVVVTTPYNKVITVIYSGKVINYKGEKCILSTSIDITDRKKLEVELIEYKNELEQKVNDRTKELEKKNNDLEQALNALRITQNQLIEQEKLATIGFLTAGIAHEINNPLNFIQGGITALTQFVNTQEECDNYPEVKEIIGAMEKGVSRVTRIVKQLNRYSRKNLEFKYFSISSVIDECTKELQKQASHSIRIIKTYEKKADQVYSDTDQVYQILLNLLVNSIHAIKHDGEIEIRTASYGDITGVIIKDNGVGMNQEQLDRIFEPFYTTKKAGKGTGLGLALSLKMIKELNGRIQIKSELGKGTEVFVELPKEPLE